MLWKYSIGEIRTEVKTKTQKIVVTQGYCSNHTASRTCDCITRTFSAYSGSTIATVPTPRLRIRAAILWQGMPNEPQPTHLDDRGSAITVLASRCIFLYLIWTRIGFKNTQRYQLPGMHPYAAAPTSDSGLRKVNPEIVKRKTVPCA